MWYLNLASQQPQCSIYKTSGKVKFPKKSVKWSVLPLRCTLQYFESEYCPLKYMPFDPGSRSRIVRWMKHYHDFDFPVFTDKGNPSVDPEDLASIGHEGELMVRYLKVVKDLGQIYEGDGSILKAMRHDNTVKSRIDQNGASATGRFTSSAINLNQIPAQREFRTLFAVPNDDWVFMGTDFDGQENINLAESLFPFDGGALWDIIQHGSKSEGTDLHSINAGYCGIARDDAKPLWFGFLYGSSATLTGYTLLGTKPFDDYTQKEFDKMEEKLLKRTKELEGVLFYPIKKGKLVRMSEQLVKQALFGKKVQADLVSNTKGLAELIRHLKKSYKQTGYVETLGGRRLTSDSDHKLLNYSSQGQGAESMKYYLTIVYSELTKAGLVFGKDYKIQAVIYDEIDLIAKREHVETIRSVLHNAYATVSRTLGMKCTYSGAVMVGGVDKDKKGNLLHNSWYGCH